MTRMVVESKVDENGVLKLSVPIGASDANQPVRVTIESVPESTKPKSDWAARVDALAGSWEGDFEYPADLPFETRDPLP